MLAAPLFTWQGLTASGVPAEAFRTPVVTGTLLTGIATPARPVSSRRQMRLQPRRPAAQGGGSRLPAYYMFFAPIS